MLVLSTLSADHERQLATGAPSDPALAPLFAAPNTAAAPAVGSVIDGFKVVEVLSKPGRPLTLKATAEAGDEVVLKSLPANKAARARAAAAQVKLARVNDPNLAVPTAFACGSEHAFVVRRFVPGVSVEAVLAILQKETVPPDSPTWRLAAGARGGGANVTGAKVVCRIGEHAAKALAAAAKVGVTHGALKPANLMVDDTLRPIVTDFACGVARPPYEAPEVLQAADRAAARNTSAADQYALGAVLWECLTRRPVFDGDAKAQEQATLKQKPESPVKFNFKAGKEMEVITLALLEKDAKARFASIDELVAELDRYHRNEPIQRKAPGLFKKLFG
ncbi:MAG: hypothetical protein IPH13_00965 [Planctomycetes bacterium]|nr:hypothetical protein [Planctomycetota bacterium]MCC7172573.1 hypothetical protein [Planctomycetota bacterium]